MGMGAANVFIKEYDLSETVPNFKGVTGAIVIDSAKGKTNDKTLVTNENQLIDGFGIPNPKKFGGGIYSAINFLKESDSLYVVRVDKGQTYPSLLVRSKVDAVVEYDDFGYILPTPIVDPIVKPNGVMSAEDIETYQFLQYPRDREVEGFEPGVHLADKPYDGDTKIFVDNRSPVEVGGRIAFKNTTGMTREDTLAYKTYTVTETEKELIVQDYIETDIDIPGVNYDAEIKAVRNYFVPTDPASTVGMDANTGDASLVASVLTDVNIGDNISMDAQNNVIYSIANLVNTTVNESLGNPVTVSGDQGSSFVETNDDVTQVATGESIVINGTVFTVNGVNSASNPKTITLDATLPVAMTVNNVQPAGGGNPQIDDLTPVAMNNTTYIVAINGVEHSFTSSANASVNEIVAGLQTAMAADASVNVSGTSSLTVEAKVPDTSFTLSIREAGEVLVPTDYVEVTTDRPLEAAVIKGTFIRKRITQIASYNYRVFAKDLDPANPRKLRVSSNDPIAEADMIEIEGNVYTLVKKYQLENFVNTITLDQMYVDQTGAQIGDAVLDVVHADYEHHDALLVTAKNPGEWGNDISIAITDSPNEEKAFNLVVYYQGAEVESWEVSRDYIRDGYGNQLFIEDKINNQSKYINVTNNEFMTDDDDNLTEPLVTDFYWRQPVATPNFTENATTVETVWDGDNYIRVGAETINNIDINKPVQVADSLYTVAMLQSSQQNGVQDTIVFEEAIDLGMGTLLPLERYAPIGTAVSQYFNRAKEVEFTIPTLVAGELFSITVNSTTSKVYEYNYSYVSNGTDTELDVLGTLAQAINDNQEARIRASVTGNTLLVKSQIAGVDFNIIHTANMSKTITVENARDFENHPLQKISGSIMPKSSIGDVVELTDGSYNVLDAGANHDNGGDDAGFPTVGQYLIAIDTVFPDPENVDFLVFLDGGVTAKAIQQRMVEISENRMDNVSLLSVSYTSAVNPDVLAGVIEFRRELMINSSYAALYAPWVKTYDKYNDFEIYTSPESWASRALSYISSQRELWYAPAGWNNAKVSALDVNRRYTSGERDALYDNQINPIRFAPGKGMAVWGQKTLQTKKSALDRLNVRMLLIVVERGLRDYLEYQTFTINDEFTRKNIYEAVYQFLKDIQTRRGLYAFEVICDDSNNTAQIIDNNEMYVDVLLQPVKIAEYVTARVAVTRTGANFSEVQL